MTIEKELTLADFPALDEGVPFKLVKIETITQPHPYCITPKHIEHCRTGILNETEIEYAESMGAKCDICREEVQRGKRGSILPFSGHENLKALFIGVPQNEDLNSVPGLNSYLLKVKELGLVDGFAFPILNADGLGE